MKYYLSAIFACVATFAFGKTCTWTGAGDGVSYANASNWDNGVPEAGDTAVFRPSGNLFVSFSAATAGLGEWRFESGNTVFGITQAKANINFASSSRLYASEAATVAISNRVTGVAEGTQITISGGGAVEFNSDQVDNVGFIDLVDITDGTSVIYYKGNGAWRPNVTRIRNGSSMAFKGIRAYSKAQYGHQKWAGFQIDAGGVLDFYYSEGATFGAIYGEGTLRIGGTCSFTFALDSGSAAFGGDTEFYTSNASLTLTVSPENAGSTFTLSSENALANVDVVDSGALRFSSSPSSYRLLSYRSPTATGFALGSASGSPVSIFGGWLSNTADTVSILPCKTGTKLGDVGGLVTVGSSSLRLDGTGADDGIPDISVSAGGTLVLCSSYIPRSSATAESPAILEFNGGTYQVSCIGVSANSRVWPLGRTGADAAKILVTVGAGGMRMGTCDIGSELLRRVTIHATIRASTSPDGGFVRDVGDGTFIFTSPLALSGGFTSLDGNIAIDPGNLEDLAVSTNWFGTGTLLLRNSMLDVSALATGAAIRLASGAGAAFRYSNLAAVRFSNDATSAAKAKSVTIGPSGVLVDSALVRDGKGSVLYIWDRNENGNGFFDGTGSSLTVHGGISTNASGTVKQPIVMYTSLENRMYFATCLGDGSMRTFTNYKTTLDGAISSDIVALTAAATIPENEHVYVGGLKLIGSAAALTVNQNATLHVGNGVDPAIVLIDKPHIYGGGTIDFGGSEGVFAGVHESTIIGPVLKGSGGITFVSPPNIVSRSDYRYVRICNANLHSGGTYVSSVRLSPENAGAFGAGDVYVGGGHMYGGRIHFKTTGLVFTNNFHVAGWGKRDTGDGDNGTSGYGALTFTATTELSGSVELVEPTRICCLNAGDVATFSGTVSGDALQVYNGAGTVLFTHANTYTGGTEIVAATLKLSGDGSLGTGDVLLDGGTLIIDKSTDFSLSNRIHGKGTVRLEGKGSVDFAGGLDVESYGGLVSDNFTLSLGNLRRVGVSSLVGFSAVTTDAATPVKLYVADGVEFSGELPANVTLVAGPCVPQGLTISFR